MILGQRFHIAILLWAASPAISALGQTAIHVPTDQPTI
jgi:hypothetical protein